MITFFNISNKQTSKLKLFLSALIASAIFYWMPDLLISSSTPLLQVKCLSLFAIYLFFVIFWIKYTGTANSLCFFFLVYSMLTNGGQLLMIGFNIDPGLFYRLDSTALFETKILIKAIDYQTVATILFVTAALLSYNKFHSKTYRVEKIYLRDFSRPFTMKLSDRLFILVALIFIALSIASLSGRVDMGYGDNYYREDRESNAFIFKYVFYVFLYYTLYKHCVLRDKFVKPILYIATFTGVLLLLWGSRNELIPLLFGILFIFKQVNLSLTKPQKYIFIVSVILGIIILNITSTLRGMSLSNLTINVVFDSITNVGIFSQFAGLFAEMGSSLRVLADTIQRLDATPTISEPTLIYTILKGFIWLPILKAFGVQEPINWSLSNWITTSNANGFAAGWGYSILAECYYDYLFWGVIVFALIGYVYMWLECTIQKAFKNGNGIIASGWLYVAAYAIFMARADSCLMSTPIKYSFYLTILWFFFLKRKRY